MANQEIRLLDKVLLTYDETASLLGVSKSTVQKYVREGKLTVIPLGPQKRKIPRTSIDEWIAQLVEQAKAKADADPDASAA
jgi:excisionase family DNA binding protein